MKRMIYIFLVLACGCKSNVYICDSLTAHAYHKKKCMGLSRCTHEIETVSKQDAIDMGKHACHFCYPNK